MGGGTALGSLWVQAKVYGKGNAVSSCKGHVVGLHDGGRLLTLIGALVGQKAYGSVCTHLGGGICSPTVHFYTVVSPIVPHDVDARFFLCYKTNP